MKRIEKTARNEFRKLPQKEQKRILKLRRIPTAPPGHKIENRKQKEASRRWKWKEERFSQIMWERSFF